MLLLTPLTHFRVDLQTKFGITYYLRMSLLDDIIDAITNTDEKTSSVLKKCLVLSYSLKNDTLKAWVSKELNGYERDDPDLPEYRDVIAPAHGLFIGAFGQQINDQPIPSVMLKEEHRHFAERAKLTQPIAAYEGVKPDDTLSLPWPANLTGLYQSKFFQGEMALNRAWQEIPGSCFISITDTVRTKMLTFVLELREQVSDGGGKVESLSPATVQTLVQLIVVGGNNIFGSVESFVANTVQVHDKASLEGALLALGIDRRELASLEADIADDRAEMKAPSLGRRTLGWIARNAKSAGKGAVKIGTDVATSIITETIKKYLGLP